MSTFSWAHHVALQLLLRVIGFEGEPLVMVPPRPSDQIRVTCSDCRDLSESQNSLDCLHKHSSFQPQLRTPFQVVTLHAAMRIQSCSLPRACCQCAEHSKNDSTALSRHVSFGATFSVRRQIFLDPCLYPCHGQVVLKAWAVPIVG